ncbi:MAG: hypothetical protein WBQ94_04300 [Terracidiphilus sp.]
MTTTFAFDGYTLRLAEPEDLALARAWTEADRDHAGRVAPEFWVEQKELEQGYLLSDGEGPLYFFKGIVRHRAAGTVLEVNIQFPPYVGSVYARYMLRKRIGEGLVDGMGWLEEKMRGVVDEVRFESSDAALMDFCVRRLGFEETGGILRKGLGSKVSARR